MGLKPYKLLLLRLGANNLYYIDFFVSNGWEEKPAESPKPSPMSKLTNY